MRLHFAGADRNAVYNKVLHSVGAQNRLESYHTLGGKAPSEGFKNLLIDSGGFVARTKGINIDVRRYAAYLNENAIKTAFELDTNSVSETLANRKYLIEHATSTQIIPVFHYDRQKEKDLQVLLDLVENFEYIAIGGVVGAHLSEYKERLLFDRVFDRTQDKIKVHGLGVTIVRLLKMYPFYSVDSTSWISCARYCSSFNMIKDENHIAFRKIKRDSPEDIRREVPWWLKLEDYITRLWALKGITWD